MLLRQIELFNGCIACRLDRSEKIYNGTRVMMIEGKPLLADMIQVATNGPRLLRRFRGVGLAYRSTGRPSLHRQPDSLRQGRHALPCKSVYLTWLRGVDQLDIRTVAYAKNAITYLGRVFICEL